MNDVYDKNHMNCGNEINYAHSCVRNCVKKPEKNSVN